MAKPKLTPEQVAAKELEKKVAQAIQLLQSNQYTIETLPKQFKDAVTQKYGRATELLMSNPELRKIFYSQRKSDGSLEPLTNFTQKITNSQWFISRTNDQRYYDSRKDLPDAKAQLARERQDILDRIKQLSVQVSGTAMSDAEAGILADDLMRNNNNEGAGVQDTDIVRKVQAKSVGADPMKFGGQAATSASNLRAFANSMGVTLSEDSLGKYVDQIFEGNQTEENVQNMLRETAISYYGANKAVADRIRAGETVRDIFRMQTDLIESLHEDATGSVSLTDPRMAQIITGGANGAPMNYTETRRFLKSHPNYDKTRAAMDEYARITESLMRTFGAGV